MSARQVKWARKESERLRAVLGGVCNVCGYPGPVEFDCIRPMGHRHHSMGFSWRVSFYRGEHRKRNLQLLCQECNAAKGSKSMQEFHTFLNTPKGKVFIRSRIKACAQWEQLREDLDDKELGDLCE